MTTDKPSPGILWNQAGGDAARYRELMHSHGLILKPGDEGYEQASRTLPCGYPGPAAEFAKCRKPDCRRKVRPVAAYCCHACATADGDRKYEIEPYDPSLNWILCHSEGCEQRNAERGEVSVWEM